MLDTNTHTFGLVHHHEPMEVLLSARLLSMHRDDVNPAE